MQVVELKLYDFQELSDDAKEKARDWFRSIQSEDSFYAECVMDDAKEIGKCLGIDIENIYFSGFSSQGDGACFEGVYKYRAGWREALNQCRPNNKELFKIGETLQAIQKRHFYKLRAKCLHRGPYYHSGCMTVEVEHLDDIYRDIQGSESDIIDTLREFADWIYKILEDDYYFYMSNEQIDESIEINGYTFTESGARHD
jgi:hypothetical protein